MQVREAAAVALGAIYTHVGEPLVGELQRRLVRVRCRAPLCVQSRQAVYGWCGFLSLPCFDGISVCVTWCQPAQLRPLLDRFAALPLAPIEERIALLYVTLFGGWRSSELNSLSGLLRN